MDWYYPVLGGVLLGEAGLARIEERWSTFGTGAKSASIDFVGGPSALGRIWKDVVDDEQAAAQDPRRPTLVVVGRRARRVRAVHEDECQGRVPVRSDGSRVAHDPDARGLESRCRHGSSPVGQRVDESRVRVHHALVVELLARLVLLRVAMVIERKERGVCLARGRPQVDRRLAAVGADLEQRSKGGDAHGRLVESQAFVLGMKPTAAAAARLRGSSIGLLSQIRRRGERLCHTAAHVGPERAQGVVLLRLGQLRL